MTSLPTYGTINLSQAGCTSPGVPDLAHDPRWLFRKRVVV